MTRLLVLNGHPDAESFTSAMCTSYVDKARERTSEVTRIDLGQLQFDLVLRQGYRAAQPLEPDLERARDALLAASHVAWFFPLWWNAPPALVKGFIDRLFTPGFAFRYGKGALPEKLLRGRSARFVTTMDGPNLWYTLVQRRALHTSFVSSTLRFVGFAPVRANTFYGLGRMSAPARAKALREVARAAEQDVLALPVRALPRLVLNP